MRASIPGEISAPAAPCFYCRTDSVRQACIGGEAAAGADFLHLPKHAAHIVTRVTAQDRKKGKVLHRYYSEMSRALSEMQRVLKPGCAAVVVAGTSLMRGVNLDDRCAECRLSRKTVSAV